MATDYKVDYRREEILAEKAAWLRSLARRTGRFTIDVVDLIERVLVDYYADKGGLQIELFDRDNRYDDPAYVDYRPLTLHVDRVVWADARRGLSYAYFILAHEIAHILFHDHRAVAFSFNPESQNSPYVNEQRAEWQADTFAKHLTMPDEVFRTSIAPDLIAILCNIDIEIATERTRSFGRTGPMTKVSYEGDLCGECGNFTLVRNGTCMKCDTCGSTTGCS